MIARAIVVILDFFKDFFGGLHQVMVNRFIRVLGILPDGL